MLNLWQRMDSKELPQLYRSADCFVTMSLSETFGLTCLEADVESTVMREWLESLKDVEILPDLTWDRFYRGYSNTAILWTATKMCTQLSFRQIFHGQSANPKHPH